MKKSLLILSAVAISKIASAQCNELFISEYVEGTGYNKAVEIYNPTANPINLSSYVLARYANGSTTISDQLALSGTIAPNDVWVIVCGETATPPDPTLVALADQMDATYPAPCYFNGDDALTLEKSGNIVDMFGKIGEDPGTAWTDVFPYTDAAGGTWLTSNHTLIRKPSVLQGVTTIPTEFNTFAEWDTVPKNVFDSLQKHTCNCASVSIKENSNRSFISVFPNPISKENVTIKSKDAIRTIEFYSVLGNLVVRKEFENSGYFETVINTKDLPKGVYLINANLDNGKTAIEKVVIQ